MNLIYVYIMSDRKEGVLYTGVTADLRRRVSEHKSGRRSSFTGRRKLTRLVYYEAVDSAMDGRRREQEIKKWARSRKIALIASLNPAWNDLSLNWMREEFA